jgi:glutamate dehydrogenase (NAD(P)+)
VAGAIHNPDGFDVAALQQHVAQTGSVVGFPGTTPIAHRDLLEVPCTFLVPAALEGQITADNAERIRARVIVEGANGPTTPEADEILGARGTTIVPDILANSGGVIVSYFEWVQDLQSLFWSEDDINQRLERLMIRCVRDVFDVARKQGIELRLAALQRAVDRVAGALMIRGIYP